MNSEDKWKEYRKKYRKLHSEKYKEYSRKYYRENKEKFRAYYYNNKHQPFFNTTEEIITGGTEKKIPAQPKKPKSKREKENLKWERKMKRLNERIAAYKLKLEQEMLLTKH